MKIINKKCGIALISLIIIIVVGALLIVGAVLLISSNNRGTDFLGIGNNENNITYELNNKDEYIAVKNREGKFGFVDTEGNQKLDFVYTSATDFINGLSIVKNDKNQYGLIDTKGNQVINFGQYDEIYRINESEIIKGPYYNVFRVKNSEGKIGLLNQKGKLVTEECYDSISERYDKLVFKKDKNYGILNNEGKEIYTSNNKINIIDVEDNFLLISLENSNELINNITGKVILSNLPKSTVEFIRKKNEYYYVQNNVLLDEKIIYSLEDGHILDINDAGILSYMDESKKIYTYYSLTNKTQLLSLENCYDSVCTAVLLDDCVVYQDENGSIYTIDNKGEKNLIPNLDNKKLEDGFGNNIEVSKRKICKNI